MENAEKLFPGAKIKKVGNTAEGASLNTRILEILSNTEERVLTTKQLGKRLNKDWRKIASDVVTPEFLRSLKALGWRYVPVKGRVAKGEQGSRFERLTPFVSEGDLSLAPGALSAFMEA